ncbi:MAG: heat-inducible transcriptional repressor HrcA [Mycoplasma sp.]|nr:heat-inducible transcriptional repressor HrcA [Mycoplasma sp.]
MTNRQSKILRHIVEEFISTGQPVSSKKIQEKYKLEVSTATIRNEMNVLVQENYLEKSYFSSGRIPSVKGYDYFANNLIDSNSDKELEKKLNKIFAKRIVDIDTVLDEAISTISNFTNLTFSSASLETNELLKFIQLIKLDDDNATIIVVTSTGRTESKLFKLDHKTNFEDLRIAVRLFKERLIDTPLNNLNKKMEIIAPLLKEKISSHEFVIQQFVSKIFNFHKFQTQKVYGRSNIVKYDDITRNQIIKLTEILERNSIWSTIESNTKNEDDTLKISISEDNTAIISKKLSIDNITREVSVVGSTRLEYDKALNALKLLEQHLKGENKNE